MDALEIQWVDATWNDVLTPQALEGATACDTTEQFRCGNSSNVCNPDYCAHYGAGATQCPDGFFLACYDRTDTAGYVNHKPVTIQECGDHCDNDAQCTRFEYLTGQWGLYNDCWLSNDYAKANAGPWLHNNKNGSSVQINCYKECGKSGSNAFDDLKPEIQQLLTEDENESKYVHVENGSISGATINYAWKMDDQMTIGFKLVKLDTTCNTCASNYHVVDGECELNCPAGKWENSSTDTCDSCVNHCTQCEDAGTYQYKSLYYWQTTPYGWIDATWEHVLKDTAYHDATGPGSVCANTDKFNCEASGNVCNASYCDFHNSFCPEGYYLACFDRTDTAGYQQMLSTDIQSCADQCSAQQQCTRFEYNDGVWNLSKECWLSNDYPLSTHTEWLHNHKEGSTVQTNCYKKCSPSQSTNAGDTVNDDLKEFLENESIYYPNWKFKVENGNIGGSGQNYAWNFDEYNYTSRKLLFKKESTCTQCGDNKFLKWVDSGNKDDVICGDCTKLTKLKNRKAKMEKRIARTSNLSAILDAEIKAIVSLNDTRDTLIDTLTANGAKEKKIKNVKNRKAKAEARRKRKQRRKDRVDNRHDRISARLVKVNQGIAHIESGAAAPDIC